MAKTKCPKCGYTEDDCRPHDRTTYLEVCVKCEKKTEPNFQDILDGKVPDPEANY